MVSKELLSEVLKLNITYIERCNNSIIYKISVYDREEEVNIYELAYKCKEWANNLPSKRYQLYSGICPKSLNYSVCSIFSGAIEQTEEIIANSEVEAIIKACQWILDNKESNWKLGDVVVVVQMFGHIV